MIKQFFRGYKKGMENFGSIISTIVNTIILSIVYILGIGLTSILAKIVRKKFIETKVLKNKETYWSNIDSKNKSIKEFYKQF